MKFKNMEKKNFSYPRAHAKVSKTNNQIEDKQTTVIVNERN